MTTHDYLLKPSELLAAGIRTVIVASPDLQGRLIGRRIPAEGFDRVVENGVDVCTCVFAWDVEQGLELIEANVFKLCGMHNGVPDVTLRPDLGTLRRAAWLDGVAICLADPVDVKTGEPLPLSPRVMLKQELARYEELGLIPQAGTELEFYLFANSSRELRTNGFRDLVPTTLIPSDFMIHEGNTYEPFFQKLRADLLASGIEMEAAQSEWGTGQWEMTFAYGHPLEMADRHSLYKLAVRDASAAAGMTATFMARPLNGQPGSSCHVHFSLLSANGEKLFWSDTAEHNMSQKMLNALAGVLEHTPDFMAWYAPTINSYRRSNSTDVAGFGRTWGLDNRSVSVRVVGHKPQHMRFEFRLPGADTNPYLTLTGLLASARDGLERELTPPAMVEGNAYELPNDPAMPMHLAEAAASFAAAPFVQETYGADTVDHFRILLEHEWNVYQATVSDWDLNRYFDRI
ncbi:glutamine synthetase family protein [Leifsonia kafniensis]|uniref:Glutamine synthetase family protein n=1 Tax=Leifsonia kafniensis TaxID=475957 RepID=A0ABP7KGS1_9MICO